MKIICIGKNYVKHIQELNGSFDDNPTIFMKPSAFTSLNLTRLKSLVLKINLQVKILFLITGLVKESVMKLLPNVICAEKNVIDMSTAIMKPAMYYLFSVKNATRSQMVAVAILVKIFAHFQSINKKISEKATKIKLDFLKKDV